MIRTYPFSTLGKADFGWLHANYHFSFGQYFDPERMQFGNLRVINDDTIEAGKGFSPHPHKNMEIITYVRSGEVRHEDSLGNKGTTEAGDVQVMSAGTGITHSEFSHDTEKTTLFQIWILPNEQDVAPRWDTARFPKDASNNTLPLLVSGRQGDKDAGALFIYADAAIYGGRMTQDTTIEHRVSDKAYAIISDGSVTINETTMNKGDGAELENEDMITIHAREDSEVIIIDLGK